MKMENANVKLDSQVKIAQLLFAIIIVMEKESA
jgi:hypothetical protein